MPLLASEPRPSYDVVVLGSGLAGTVAALAANERGADVLVVETAPRESAGGSTRLSGGGFRVPRDGYEPVDLLEDLMLVTKNQGDRVLLEHMANSASADVAWLQGYGLRFGDPAKFRPDLNARRQQLLMGDPIPFDIDGATQIGSGNGVIQRLHATLFERVDVVCDTRATELILENERLAGVRLVHATLGEQTVRAQAVVIATGGFQANEEMRRRYFGEQAPAWRVRGTRFNVGDGIRMGLAAGAAPAGEWTDFHCAVIDARSRTVECGETNVNTYPFGILVNAAGERFLDEGEDYRDRTYAKFGKAILAQPGGVAHLVFDEKLAGLIAGLVEQWGPVSAPTLRELAAIVGVDAGGLERTVESFNGAIDGSVAFDPSGLDGRRTSGLGPDKSNWAVELDSPPYYAITVTGGLTFTFGGLKTNVRAEALDDEGRPVEGLYAAGEIQGGFFVHNYPSGSSLVRSTVYGRAAGYGAAAYAASH